MSRAGAAEDEEKVRERARGKNPKFNTVNYSAVIFNLFSKIITVIVDSWWDYLINETANFRARRFMYFL